jgi:hypothetical protein
MHRDSLGNTADAQVLASVFGVQWALRVSAVICLAMALLIYFGVKGEGAGSGREMTRRALRRMHIVHLPSMHMH